MRPVVQKAVAKVVMEIVQQKKATWEEIMLRLSELKWELGSAPWEAVFSVDGGKMLVGKDNTTNLADLLHAHLAPSSLQAIKRARKAFKDNRGKQYPISDEELSKRISKEEVAPNGPRWMSRCRPRILSMPTRMRITRARDQPNSRSPGIPAIRFRFIKLGGEGGSQIDPSPARRPRAYVDWYQESGRPM